MANIIATEYITLDGVMEAPNKWSFDFWSEDSAAFKYQELFASGSLLLGRETYTGFAAAWPTMEGTGDFGERMNSLPKYVVSTTLEKAEWNNSHIIKENVLEELKKLKETEKEDILLCGSAQLFRSLMEANLIDEYRLMLHPVVVGTGKRLFTEDVSRKSFSLIKTQTFSGGIVVLTYQPK